jgi:hypothetical protein
LKRFSLPLRTEPVIELNRSAAAYGRPEIALVPAFASFVVLRWLKLLKTNDTDHLT